MKRTVSWKDYFVEQTAYHYWANEVLFESLEHLDAVALATSQGLYFDTIHHTMDHILLVAQQWRARLQGQEIKPDFFKLHHPNWGELKSTLRVEMLELQAWLNIQTDSWFDEEVTYQSIEGGERNNTVRDMLTHLMFHMAHHRGQVSGAATRLGAPPAEMDYIYYRRFVSAKI